MAPGIFTAYSLIFAKKYMTVYEIVYTIILVKILKEIIQHETLNTSNI